MIGKTAQFFNTPFETPSGPNLNEIFKLFRNLTKGGNIQGRNINQCGR